MDFSRKSKKKKNTHGIILPIEAPCSPPTITKEPISKALTANKKLVLRVRAKGSEPLNYQWLHNGVVIPEATSANLIIPYLTEENAGVYSCDIKNASGFAYSAKAFVKIVKEKLPQPTLTIEELCADLQNSRDTLVLSITDFPEDFFPYFSVHWYHNGKLLQKTREEFLEISTAKDEDLSGCYHAVIATNQGRIKTNPTPWNLEQVESTDLPMALPIESIASTNDTSPGSNEKKKVFLERFLAAWQECHGTQKVSPRKTKKKIFLEKALSHFSQQKKTRTNVA